MASKCSTSFLTQSLASHSIRTSTQSCSGSQLLLVQPRGCKRKHGPGNRRKERVRVHIASTRCISTSRLAPDAATETTAPFKQESSHVDPVRSSTEEAVTSANEDGKGGTGAAPDEVNALVRYPLLYDPIRKPRNPVVLCHGLYGFDSWGLDIIPALRIHYWAEVLAVLKGVVGIEPIITSVPGTGAVTKRAEVLHKQLTKDLKGRSFNLVAHSMGGLDCRYLLSHIKPTEYNPLSLTTLATPHRGSHFMSWCRANIGIGDIAQVAAAASSATSSTAPGSDPDQGSGTGAATSKLPYSLRTPLLTRKQQEDAAKRDLEKQGETSANASAMAAEKVDAEQGSSNSNGNSRDKGNKDSSAALTAAKAVLNFPGLNYSLGTSLASYLLDLLDSPAYGNLTPEYLNGSFNPSTPDRPDIRYFSVAARASKLSVAHPLWLPKLILDKTEELEKANQALRTKRDSRGWQWGNDGLVPVESAKWGEFLGVMEDCDHWALRGGSGLSADPKPKKQQAAQTSQSTIASSLPEAARSLENVFGWQDVNRAVGSRIDARDTHRSASSAAPDSTQPSTSLTKQEEQEYQRAVFSSGNAGTKDTFSTLTNIASWITKRIPLPISSSASNANKLLRSSINPAYPIDEAVSYLSSMTTNLSSSQSSSSSSISSSSSSASSSSSGTSKKSSSYSSFDTARLLFGSSSSSPSKGQPHSSSTSSNKKPKFEHERFYVALCKKLYDEGL